MAGAQPAVFVQHVCLICPTKLGFTAQASTLRSRWRFGLFRLFDILKPWPVSWADKKSTPFGVMFDDVLAGIMAAITMVAIILLGMIF